MTKILLLILLLCCNTTFSQSVVSRQEAINDIDFYDSIIQQAHYKPFLHIDNSKYFDEVKKIKKSIPDSINTNLFISLFYKVTELLDDAHNQPHFVQPILKEEYQKAQFFPYELISENNKLYSPLTTSKACGIPVGAEIISINDKNVSSFFKQIQDKIAGIKSFKKVLSEKLFFYFLFLDGIKPPFTLQYKISNGDIKTIKIEKGLNFKEALGVNVPAILKNYDYKILDNNFGYLDIRNLGGNFETFKSFLDSCFQDLKKRNIKNLAIDFRKNSGGNTTYGQLLISYFSHNKFAWGNEAQMISQPYKDYLLVKRDSANDYLNKTNGTIITYFDCKPHENKFNNASIFKGKVYLLTGSYTFSSAMDISNVMKVYKIAELVGEPTGENQQDFGEAFTFELPNSRIQIQTTSAYFFGVDCNKKNNSPVIPDIIIKTSFNDRIYGKDRVLEYLLSKTK